MTHPKLRAATRSDLPALKAIAARTDMFTPEELAGFAQMMEAHFEGDTANHWWIEAAPTPRAAAFAGPEEMADGVWNLWFIGVEPEARRLGLGAALIHRAEQTARQARARLLLIETSSGPQFPPARALYTKEGYTVDGETVGFYGPGQNKLIFRKTL